MSPDHSHVAPLVAAADFPSAICPSSSATFAPGPVLSGSMLLRISSAKSFSTLTVRASCCSAMLRCLAAFLSPRLMPA